MKDLSLGQPISRGRTADIFAWEDGYVLKLFHNWFGLEAIQYEAKISRALQASRLPVPFVDKLIRVNGRNGLVYERVNGLSMQEEAIRKPWRLFDYAHLFATLQAQMHTRAFEVDLPPQHQKLENKIRHANALPAHLQSAALSALTLLTERLPEGGPEGSPTGGRICHGDFHPGNILMTEHGPVVIDWIDSSLGNPLADVARSTILLLGAAASNQIPSFFMKAFIRLFHAVSIRHYFNLCPGGEAEYRRWLPVVAAARLSENIPELESWLVAQVQKNLEE